jgi:hypothetical protein
MRIVLWDYCIGVKAVSLHQHIRQENGGEGNPHALPCRTFSVIAD